MSKITGQKPAVTRRRSGRAFKVRDGQAIGCKVTLRGDRITSPGSSRQHAIPRIGISRNQHAFFDGAAITAWRQGADHFPEIQYDNRSNPWNGITISTWRTTITRRALLEAFNFPFRK